MTTRRTRAAAPASAALVVPPADGAEVVVVALQAAAYDPEAGTVTYKVVLLGSYHGAWLAARQADREVPATFGPGSLFIDSKGQNVPSAEACRALPGYAFCPGE